MIRSPGVHDRQARAPSPSTKQLGLRYLTFVVTNLAEVIQRLEAAYIAFTRPKNDHQARDHHCYGQKIPNGHIVAFVERWGRATAARRTRRW